MLSTIALCSRMLCVCCVAYDTMNSLYKVLRDCCFFLDVYNYTTYACTHYSYQSILIIAVYRTYPRSHYDDRKVTKKNSKVPGVGHSSSSGLATSNSSTESLSPKTSMDLAMQKLASLNVSGGTECMYVYMC